MNELFGKVDVEVYEKYGKGEWAQAKYLVHGMSDVFWLDSLEEVLEIIRNDLEETDNEVS